jgi:hypothetical protein
MVPGSKIVSDIECDNDFTSRTPQRKIQGLGLTGVLFSKQEDPCLITEVLSHPRTSHQLNRRPPR